MPSEGLKYHSGQLSGGLSLTIATAVLPILHAWPLLQLLSERVNTRSRAKCNRCARSKHLDPFCGVHSSAKYPNSHFENACPSNGLVSLMDPPFELQRDGNMMLRHPAKANESAWFTVCKAHYDPHYDCGPLLRGSL